MKYINASRDQEQINLSIREKVNFVGVAKSITWCLLQKKESTGKLNNIKPLVAVKNRKDTLGIREKCDILFAHIQPDATGHTSQGRMIMTLNKLLKQLKTVRQTNGGFFNDPVSHLISSQRSNF